jgi:hypothetical protein
MINNQEYFKHKIYIKALSYLVHHIQEISFLLDPINPSNEQFYSNNYQIEIIQILQQIYCVRSVMKYILSISSINICKSAMVNNRPISNYTINRINQSCCDRRNESNRN